MNNYDEFLIGTKYCDTENLDVQNITKILTSSCKGDDVASAIRIYNWVRDEVKYNFDFWNIRASETIKKRKGMCANKANLQIAMLRSAGIPAGYTVLRIKKEAIRVIANDEIYDQSSDIIVHVYCCVLLGKQWIGADASVDREIYDSAYINVPGWEFGEWDGQTHFHVPDHYILDATGPYANIDEYMDMPHRFINDGIIDRANKHIEQLRMKVRPLVGNL